jgi:osmoprotectant transport system permease protein
MNELLTWLGDPANWQGPAGIPSRLIEHLWISFVSVAAATLIAVPVGLYIGHTGRLANLAINIANIGRAVPSYAILVMVLPVSLALAPVVGYPASLGLSFIPTFTAMVLLAIPPILVNIYAGLRSVDRDLVESARGMGLRESQILRDVEVPLAAPVIVGGFRTAVLNVIATATIGAVVGFGGLGRFILDGRSRGVLGTGELLGGALLVGALAIGVDLALAGLQRIVAARAERATSRAGAPVRAPA